MKGHRRRTLRTAFLPPQKDEHLSFREWKGHIRSMTKRSASSTVTKSAKAPASGSYKLAGKLSDGVTILLPKTKPTHFTSKEIKATIEQLRKGSSA
jgi:hypothetical protein